eukprot:Rmarinus@m.3493
MEMEVSFQSEPIHVRFSDGSQLVFIMCKDGTVWEWDLTRKCVQAVDATLPNRNRNIFVFGECSGIESVAIPSYDDVIYVCRRKGGHWELSLSLCGHVRFIRCLAMHEQLLASGSQDGSVRLWNIIDSSSEVLTSDCVAHAVVFCPRGERLATVESDPSRVIVWHVPSRTRWFDFAQRRRSDIKNVAFSPDGSLLVCYTCTMICGWDVNLRRRSFAVNGRNVYGTSLCFAPASAGPFIFATAGFQGGVRLWSATTGDLLRVLDHSNCDEALSVTFRPDGRKILAGYMDDTVRLWDICGACEWAFKGGSSLYSEKGPFFAGVRGSLVVAAGSGQVRALELPRTDIPWTERPEILLDSRIFQQHVDDGRHPRDWLKRELQCWPVQSVAACFAREGRGLIIVTNDTLHLPMAIGTTIPSQNIAPRTISLSFSTVCGFFRLSWDGTRAHLVSRGRELVSISLFSGFRIDETWESVLNCSEEEHEAVRRVCAWPVISDWFSTTWRSQKRIVVASQGPLLLAMPTPTLARVWRFSAPVGSQEGNYMAGRAEFAGELRANSDVPFHGGFAFSSDGTRVAATMGNGSVWVWDLFTRNRIIVTPGSEVSCMAFTPRGDWLGIGDGVGNVRAFDASQGGEVACTRVHHAGVLGLEFCPFPLCNGCEDTEVVVSWTEDEVKLWEWAKPARQAKSFGLWR